MVFSSGRWQIRPFLSALRLHGLIPVVSTAFEWGVSAVTLGELRLGVLQAQNPETASRRLSTYQLAQQFEALTVDEAVSEAWALLISRLRAAGRKAPINDSWIAATAIAHRVPIVTQDSDYDDMPGVEVIRI